MPRVVISIGSNDSSLTLSVCKRSEHLALSRQTHAGVLTLQFGPDPWQMTVRACSSRKDATEGRQHGAAHTPVPLGAEESSAHRRQWKEREQRQTE